MALNISFEGKRILVTGGGNGIGRALCKRLYSQGAQVNALCRNSEWLQSLETECPGIKTICVDLQDWTATREAVSKLEPMDCLVNNAGVGVTETIMETTSEGFDKVMSVNLKGMINVGQIIAQKMMDHNISGAIVNVSSMSSMTGTRQSVTYAMSKAATDMLTKSMAMELGPKNIRVNGVNPNIVAGTVVSKTLFDGSQIGDLTKRYAIARTPLGRFCEIDEVINTILFLLSDAAPMIHGESIFIDGGYRTVYR